MGWVRVAVAAAGKKQKVLAAAMVPPGATEPVPWLRPNDPVPDGPFALFPQKSADVDLEKGIAWANAIDVASVLIVRKSLVAPTLAPLVDAGEMVLRPAHVYRAHPSKKLAWKNGILDDDFVLVDVRARFPADRAKLAESAFAPGAAPYASMLKWVPAVDFGKDRAPRFSMFRSGDESSLLVTTTKLFAALQKALGPAVREGGSGPRFFLLDASSNPPFTETAAEGKAAAEAFYRMYSACKSSTADRKRALASPIWAYWLAVLVDGKPADDTRAAACKHPFFAYAYARDVDRGPHAATRGAVAKNGDAAREYALHVDRAVHASLRDALSYHVADVELRARANAQRFAASTPAAREASRAPAEPAYQRLVLAPNGKGVVFGSLQLPGGESYFPFNPPAPGSLVFRADEDGGKGRYRKQKSLAHLGALRNGNDGPLIVRRSKVAGLFAGLEAEVELRPCVLHDFEGALDDDFAILDVKTYVPMDPSASDATWAHEGMPWLGGATLVHRFGWTEKTRPKARIFRVREFPFVVLAEASLADALANTTNRAVRGSTEPPTAEEMTPLLAPPKKAPSAALEKKAATAMDAFYKGNRQAALAHPLGALAVALADRRPSADTRKATLASPPIALAYALYVDKKPRPDTRTAAAKNADTAYRYARHVDVALHPETRRALDRKQWSDADIASWSTELAAVRRARET